MDKDHQNIKLFSSVIAALLLYNACTLLSIEICVTNNSKLKIHPKKDVNLKKRKEKRKKTHLEVLKTWYNMAHPWQPVFHQVDKRFYVAGYLNVPNVARPNAWWSPEIASSGIQDSLQ